MLENVWPRERREANPWKGLAAGLVAGLVASWAMNQFQALWSKLTEDKEESQKESQESGGEQETPATVKAASAISEEVFHHELTKSEREVAGPAVHYAFGTVTGGVYGAMAELAPDVTTGAGLPFGTAVWLLADEVTVPLVGLSKSPAQYPLSKHAYALASHFVYGLTTEAVRRAVRSAM
ncbi:MAG TPA: DUF1440 domain-containing protein [Blastocatellia bacterium]|nr:DUF1440 domain-containing protein [Blastocatellia bacterium]